MGVRGALRVPSCRHSYFHEGVQAQGGPAGSRSFPACACSESKALEPGRA